MTTNSPNISEIELQNLYQLFPQFVTDGKFDFEAFKAYMTDEIETSKEPYKMTRHGKSEAKRRAKQPSILTLRPQQDLSTDRNTTQNLFIEWDNWEVLKLLLSHYYNKIKMIYIDPPYNKDKDFVYSDTRKEPLEAYLRQTGQRDDEGATDTDIEKSWRKHSNWLNMMYPRLRTARKLLKEDWVIFVSIDDDEIANLRKLMDEIFGEENCIETFFWKSIFRPSNMWNLTRKNSEYILMYAKNKNSIHELVERESETQWDASLTQNNNKARTLKFPPNKVVIKLEDQLVKKWQYWEIIIEEDFLIQGWANKDVILITGKFKRSQDYLNKEIAKWVKLSIKSNSFIPYYRKVYQLTKLRPTKLLPTDLVGDVLESNATINSLFWKKVFDYPKPISLVQYLCRLLPVSSDDIILDFFAWSWTTAHAVIDLNKQDWGNRKWICVQLPEVVDEKQEAYKAWYRTISELSRARIDKVIEKSTIEWVKGDLWYRVLTLDKSNFKELNPVTVQVWATTEENLNALIQQELITTGAISWRTDLDIIYELILRQWISLLAHIEQDTYGVYTISDDTRTFYVNLQAPTLERIHMRIQEHQENKACTLYMLEEKLSESQRINLDEYVRLITL